MTGAATAHARHVEAPVRIDADLLLPGGGDPIEHASVLVDGGVLQYVGSRAQLPRGAPPVADVHVPVLMPGLWDVHCHLHGIRTFSLEAMLTTPVPTAAARSAKDAEAALQAGFTSIREAGGLGIWVAPAIEEGTVVGPTIYAAGSVLSPTGGHADVHGVPLPWVADSCEDGRFLHLCDGVPDCLRAVRTQLRHGARVIKVCASGGVTSTVDDPHHQQFSDEEIVAMVGEAARAERVVMAHCHGKAGIMAALRAGVHTIEHGSFLDEEAARAMRDSGAVLVPTRTIIDRMLGQLDAVPPHAGRKIAALADRHAEAVRIAIDVGVTIALGTDIGTTGQESLVPWGSNGSEAVLLGELGLDARSVLDAATVHGPETLGPQAPRSGRLQHQYDADMIALTSNPLNDLRVLAEPRNITHVWKRGALVKTPLESALQR